VGQLIHSPPPLEKPHYGTPLEEQVGLLIMVKAGRVEEALTLQQPRPAITTVPAVVVDSGYGLIHERLERPDAKVMFR
jgi:hypothetical protein